MPYPLPLTRTEAYLAYKAGVIQQSDLKPSLAVPRNGIDAWLAYWTGLAEDYPKREDGTPHILQEEEAYIAYLCGVINEYPEKCLRRVGAYLRYLISARWGRPDHPLNREELYLSLIKTQFIPSGDPSSDIEIDRTAKAAFVDVKMYGDTFQQSYEGNNLYLATPYPSGTQQGITSTITDGCTFNLVGEPTTSYANIADWTTVALEPGTYTLCIDHALSHAITMRLSFNPVTQDITISAGQTEKTFTVSSAIVSVRVFIGTSGAGAQLNETFMLNLVSGSEPISPLEPYCGKKLSPNPEYPQSIQTVTGLQKVEVQGKNLLETNPKSGLGITVEKLNDGKIHIYGTSTSTYANISLVSYQELPAGTYTFSVTAPSSKHNWHVRLYDAPTGGSSIDLFIDKNQTKQTFTLDKTYYRMYEWIGIGTPGVTIDDTVGLMIEKGSTATSFEQYSKQDYGINLGKNLFDTSLDPSYKSPHESLTKNSTGMTVTAALENHSTTWSEFVEYVYTLAPYTTYTLSKKSRVISGGQYMNAGALRVHNVSNGTYGTAIDADRITFTTDGSGKIGLLFYAAYQDTTQGAVSTSVEFYDVQLEAGESQTSFAKYFEPIELCKLGTYQDYIYKDGDDWKVHKAISSITLDGTEDWVYASNYNYARCPSYTFVDKPLSNTFQLSNYFGAIIDWGTFRDSTSRNAFFPLLDEGYKISIRNTDCSSVEEYKSWLAANKPSFYFSLATPTDTIITDTNLIAQLEALVKGGSEEGTTYIKVSTPGPNLPGLLYVEAAKYV